MVGPATVNVWALTGTGSGTLDGTIQFVHMANLTGGSEADTFQFISTSQETGLLPPVTGSLAGSLDGGGGVNTPDYSRYIGNVTVILPLGRATGVRGIVSGIRDVIGSSGQNPRADPIGADTAGPLSVADDNLLVGDGTGNHLTGGSGRNIFIAGASPGVLLGGTGEGSPGRRLHGL